jgi:hypothetical protein
MNVTVNSFTLEINCRSAFLRLPFMGEVFAEWAGLWVSPPGCGASLKTWASTAKDDSGSRSFWFGRLFIIHSPAVLCH